MSPDLAAAIDVARDLAWRSTANLGGRTAHLYQGRYEAHAELARRMDRIVPSPRRTARWSLELTYLVLAMHRVSHCSFANRRGEPYYERKAAVLELRGCLDVYDRSVAQ